MFRLGLPLVFVGLLGIASYGFSGFRLRRLPRPTATSDIAAHEAELPYREEHHRAILHKAAHWSVKLSVHPVLLAAMCAVFGLWAYLDTKGFSTLTKPTILLAALFLYAVVAEMVYAVSDMRQFVVERHLARNAAMTKARVVEQEPRTAANRIHYRFRDLSDRVEAGSGDDLTGFVFENMPVTVVFDPNDPKYNLPVTGMRFFTATAAD